MKPRVIEEREKGFSNYLQHLLREGELVASPELREFLEIPLEAAAFSDDEFVVDYSDDEFVKGHSADLSQAATTPDSSLRVASWQRQHEESP